MDFHDFPDFPTSAGNYFTHPPKVCASMLRSTNRGRGQVKPQRQKKANEMCGFLCKQVGAGR